MRRMQTWSITFHGAAGVISSVDTGESQFVVGTETASDVITVRGEGVAGRHAWVWIRTEGLQVEALGGGTLVNGYSIMERVEVEYPASVQVGEITLVIEVRAVQPAPVSPTSNSMDITVARRAVTANKASLDVAVPERTSKNAIVQPQLTDLGSSESAPLQSEYKLVREIARGGMGQIYFCEDAQLERQVAVKVSSVSEGTEDLRFIKQAKVLAQLAHPKIVPVHNIGVNSKGRPFYSMN